MEAVKLFRFLQILGILHPVSRLYGQIRKYNALSVVFIHRALGKYHTVLADDYPDIKLYQVYYDACSAKKIDPQFTPYFNSHCTKYFVDQVIVEMYEAGLIDHADYCGVVSWRIWHKCIRSTHVRAQIYEDNKAHDFYYFTRRIPGVRSSPIWQERNLLHRSNIVAYSQRLLAEIGLKTDLLNLDVLPAFFSAQICKTPLYCDYIENCLKPMIAIMEDPSRLELQEWLNQDAHYARYGEILSHEALQKITGFPYYTKHALITECLFPTYAALKGWKGKEIRW